MPGVVDEGLGFSIKMMRLSRKSRIPESVVANQIRTLIIFPFACGGVGRVVFCCSVWAAATLSDARLSSAWAACRFFCACCSSVWASLVLCAASWRSFCACRKFCEALWLSEVLVLEKPVVVADGGLVCIAEIISEAILPSLPKRMVEDVPSYSTP